LERSIAERTKELSTSEQLCRSTIECSALATTLSKPDGQWLEINQAAVDFLGYSRSELRRLSTKAVTHAEDRELESSVLAQLLRGELSNYELEKRYIHKQRYVVWGLVNVAVFRDDAGNASHLIRQTQNITARKHRDEATRTILTDLQNLDGQDYFDSSVAAIVRIAQVDGAFIIRYTRDNRAELTTRSYSRDGLSLANHSFRSENTPFEKLIDRGQALIVEGDENQRYRDCPVHNAISNESFVAVTMQDTHGNIVGHIGATSPEPSS
jgi:PAS domain S-box-containing protein